MPADMTTAAPDKNGPKKSQIESISVFLSQATSTAAVTWRHQQSDVTSVRLIEKYCLFCIGRLMSRIEEFQNNSESYESATSLLMGNSTLLI